MEMQHSIDDFETDEIDLFRDVLRISPEPYAYLDEREVHQRLTADPGGYLAYVRERLRDVAQGRATLEMPPKQLFIDPGMAGDYRVMPCVLRRGDDVTKTVKIVGTNLAQTQVPDQITVGKAFALHPHDNFISHVFEACLLSSARTGVCASLAVELLADAPTTLALLGAGRVGYYAALYTCMATPLSSIEIYDPSPARAQRLAEQLSRDLPGVQCRASQHPPSDADVMILASSSVEPICHPAQVSASLVVSLGADTDAQHELSADWVGQADIFVDTHDSGRYGDIKQWQDAGLLDAEVLTDLFALLAADKVPGSRGRRVFVSTGSAMFDNLTIGYMLSQQV